MIHKHTAKYIITLSTPKIIIKKILLLFFTVFKNKWKEHKF